VLDGIEMWAVGLAASPWIFAILLAFVIVDAFFPPIPSETLVIALAALTVSAGGPPLWLIVVVTAVGALVGDLTAYMLGRHLQIRGWRVFRNRKVQSAFQWADRALTQRPAPLIIAARYIPVGRVAVNMTAGSLTFPLPRFVGLASIAGLSWAAYSTLIGVGAGVWLGDQPLLATALGVMGGVSIGFGVDWVIGAVLRRGRTVTDRTDKADRADGEALGSAAAIAAVLGSGVPQKARTAPCTPAQLDVAVAGAPTRVRAEKVLAGVGLSTSC
jgi:membrane-associated protein